MISHFDFLSLSCIKKQVLLSKHALICCSYIFPKVSTVSIVIFIIAHISNK